MSARLHELYWADMVPKMALLGFLFQDINNNNNNNDDDDDDDSVHNGDNNMNNIYDDKNGKRVLC